MLLVLFSLLEDTSPDLCVDNTQILMKSQKRAVGCLVSFFSPLQTFLLPFFLPHLGPRNSPGTWGVALRAGFFLVPLIPSPGSCGLIGSLGVSGSFILLVGASTTAG